MGSYEGHAIPGAFFIIYGLVWLLNTYVLYFGNRSVKSSSGKANGIAVKREYELNKRSWLPLPCLPRFHIEPVVKVLCCIVGLLVELLIGKAPDPDHEGQTKFVFMVVTVQGDHMSMAKLQHATMYAFFMISGLIDLLSLLVRIPKKTGQLFFAIAFFVEGSLFYFHGDQRLLLDVRVHFILIIAIFGGGIAALFRMYSACNLMINSSLSFFLLYQGMWFVQAANIMYGKNAALWKWEDPHHAMLVAVIGTWHVMLVSTFMLITWLIVHFVLKCRRSRKANKKSTTPLIPQKLRVRMNLNSDEEDVESKVGLMEGERKEENEPMDSVEVKEVDDLLGQRDS